METIQHEPTWEEVHALESRIPLNMNVLSMGRVPKVMGLKDVLVEWLAHRREVLQRRSRHRLAAIDRTSIHHHSQQGIWRRGHFGCAAGNTHAHPIFRTRPLRAPDPPDVLPSAARHA